MACKIRYLSSAGIMPREINGVSALAHALPQDWLLYVSLNCFPPQQSPMEIDALVVTDQCVLLLEIKDWNGKLTTSGDTWMVGKQRRGRSPVILGAEKARKLKTILKRQLGPMGAQIYVDHRVILTGSADKSQLPHDQAQFVWTLQEACSLGDPQRRSRLLPKGKLSLFKLCDLEKDFDRVTGNTKLFQPLEADWGGFQVIEKNLFVHPRGIWHDHRGVRKDESRIKAMIRTWSFDKLPAGLNSNASRRDVAARETRAFAYLTEVGSKLVAENRVLRDISHPHDEILTQHFEVRGVEDGWTTLDRFLESRRDELSLEDRYVLATAVQSIVAQLHSVSVTHRDLGPRALWVGSPTGVALTGLMSCQLPDQGTVGNWLDDLRGYAPALPEDGPVKVPSTGRQRDVYMLGYLAALILTGERPHGGAEVAVSMLPSTVDGVADWLRKAMSPDPVQRFGDAGEMLAAFSACTQTARVGFDRELLDRFETPDNPYMAWLPVSKALPSRPECTVYESESSGGEKVVVKIWNQLRRGLSDATDLALYRLLDSAARLKTAPVPGLPRFLDSGLSSAGPFVVYEHASGEPLSAIASFSEDEALSVARSILETVNALHALGCEHGDISPGNTLFDRDRGHLVLIDAFDVTAVGDGSLRTPSVCPEGWEMLGQMALDRYACLAVIRDILERSEGSSVEGLRAIVNRELQRPSIDTLDGVVAAVASLLAPPPEPLREITLSTFNTTNGFQGGRGFRVQAQSSEDGTEKVILTTETGQLVMEADGEHVLSHSFRPPTFAALAYQSRAGTPVDISLAVKTGQDDGFDELYRTLKLARLSDGLKPQAQVDVAWQWRRLMELEEESRIEVEITEVIGSRDGVAICRYQNLGREFDFDADAAVDAYTTSNRRLGEIDRGLSEFPTTLALRMERRVSVGDRLWLVDRREQTSIERRNRAVTRILERRSAIPGLIDFFSPACSTPATDYPATISEEEVAAYSLNKGQQAAFEKLLRAGPLGLLQGPPGTGKTRFIAAFVHWLLTRGGAQRILIASQSHEAVNNAIESLLLLYKRQGGRPNLLRIGSKGITARIKPFHSAELRERYRLKFEAAAKLRYTQLAAAKGVPRKFAAELFDLDSELGTLARKLDALQKAFGTTGRVAAEELARRETRLRRAEAAFRKAAARLQDAASAEAPARIFEQAVEALVARNPELSPSDVAAAQQLLRLTRDWISALGSPQRNFEEFLAKTRNVVAATCVGVGQTRIRIDSQLFDWVIVDEAARCTSGELAVPMQMARRVLLVGDHLQLRPMVDRGILDALHQEHGADEPRGELEASDFERAFSSPYGAEVSCRFTEQYRMDETICRMVSQCFYEPHSVALKTSEHRSGGLAVDPASPRWLRSPITWVDTSGHDNVRERRPQGSTTRYNEAEVEAILHLLEDIANDRELVEHLNKGEDETPIGVICMYAGQKSRLERAWLQHPWDAKFRRLVRIDTVDAYQGKENEIVIVSLVCCNPMKDIGHVRSANRCNVALSRARERLVIVGAAEMFAKLAPQTPITSVLNYISRSQDDAAVVSWKDLR